MWSFIINKHPCIINSNDFKSLKTLCLYIATITVYIALLKYNKGTNPTPVDMWNCPIHVQLPMHDKILQKNNFMEIVWPANYGVFVYVSIHNAETLISTQ